MEGITLKTCDLRIISIRCTYFLFVMSVEVWLLSVKMIVFLVKENKLFYSQLNLVLVIFEVNTLLISIQQQLQQIYI